MLGIEIRIHIKPEKRDEFLQAVESLQRPGGAGDSTSEARVYEERGHRNRFLWVEHWQDRQELSSRLESAKFRALLGAVRVLGTVSDVQVVDAEAWSGSGQAMDRLGTADEPAAQPKIS